MVDVSVRAHAPPEAVDNGREFGRVGLSRISGAEFGADSRSGRLARVAPACTGSPGASLLGEEVGDAHAKGHGDALHIDEADVSLTPLNTPDVGSVQAALLGKALLRPPLRFAQGAYTLSESPRHRLHGAAILFPRTLSVYRR
jgi:hypothetical protein